MSMSSLIVNRLQKGEILKGNIHLFETDSIKLGIPLVAAGAFICMIVSDVHHFHERVIKWHITNIKFKDMLI